MNSEMCGARVEGCVPKKLFAVAAVLFLSVLSAQAQEQQEQPQSLGEIARQARKAKEEKEKNSGPAKTVVTDDSLASSKPGSALSFTQLDNGKAPTSEALANAQKLFDRADRMLNLLEPMDKTTLAKHVLEGRDVDFPGRRSWEDKLYAAKQYYVSHGRDLIRETRDLLSTSQSLKASGAGPNDPRVQDLGHRALQLMQDASRTDADFEAVLLEGQDMAKQAAIR
jgi:hypothetical protein